MADTNIEYLTKSWNPIQTKIKGPSGNGYHCTHVSKGCHNCWAEEMNNRFGNKHPFNTKKFEYEIKKSELNKPFSWCKPQRVGVQFMGDLFHEDISFELVNEVFDVMCTDLVRKCKHDGCELTEDCFKSVIKHDYFILTKRPERILEFINWVKENGDADYPFAMTLAESKKIPKNIWIGTSVSDQPSANKRVPELLKLRKEFLNVNLWLSVEPLLDRIDLDPVQLIEYKGLDTPLIAPSYNNIVSWLGQGIDWVVASGESGKGARPLHPDWVRKIRDDCKAAGVKFFFKQWGEWLHINMCSAKVGINSFNRKFNHKYTEISNGVYYDTYARLGKKKAGRLLDGIKHNEFPGKAI